MNLTVLSQYAFFIGKGLHLTLALLLGSLLGGITLGVFLAILRRRKILGWAASLLISLLRGIPLILQLSFIFYVLPQISSIRLSILAAGILAFSFNSAAYVAEIIRSGIESLGKGPFEAAIVLKIPPTYLWKDIILPQVFKRIFPALISEMIALLKETPLISIIGGMDLMRRAQYLSAQHFDYLVPLCISATYYYSLVLLIEWVGKKIQNGLAC